MKKSILLIIFLFSLFELKSQVTFESIFNKGEFNSVIELSGPTYIFCGPDSDSYGATYRIDKYGMGIFETTYPMVRGDYMTIADFTRDPVSGGFALCGSSGDTAGTATGTYLLIDSTGQNVDSIFYSGGINGPDGISILRTSTNDFIAGFEAWFGAGTYNAAGNKIIYPGTNSWSAAGGSNLTYNGMDVDANDNFLIAGFGWTAAAAASLDLYDSSGTLLHTFGIADTAYGNSLVFESCSAIGPNGTYLFGVDLSPSSLTYGVPYINCLDTGFNVLWEKYLDWGYYISVTALTKTSDSCIVLLLSTENGLAIHKLRANGDSLWTQFHNRPTTGIGNRFRECSDRGFIVAGSWNDTLLSETYQYALKTDSLGRLLPLAMISTTTTIVCPDDNFVLSASPVGPGYTYLWSTLDTTQTINDNQAQGYTVQVTDSNGLSAISDTLFMANYSVQIPNISLVGPLLTATGTGIFQWILNGTPIPGANMMTYDPMLDGTYTVELVDTNGCVTESGPYIITDIGEIENRLTITETANQLRIECRNGIREVSVYDISGKLILKKQSGNSNIQIEKNQFQSGIYVISVIVNNGRVERKLFERN